MSNSSKSTLRDISIPPGKAARVIQLPRTITKKALRIFFEVSPFLFRKYYYTPDLRNKLGINDSIEDRNIQTFTIEQTKIIIEHFQLSEGELKIIHSHL